MCKSTLTASMLLIAVIGIELVLISISYLRRQLTDEDRNESATQTDNEETDRLEEERCPHEVTDRLEAERCPHEEKWQSDRDDVTDSLKMESESQMVRREDSRPHEFVRWARETREYRMAEVRKKRMQMMTHELPADYDMTRLSGMEGLELISRCQGFPCRPAIILLSEGEAPPSPRDLGRLGVLGVIEKPLILDSLARLLAGILKKVEGATA